MSTSSILVLTSLALFNVLFIGRTVMLYRQGVKVWTIGTSGGNILERLFENILLNYLKHLQKSIIISIKIITFASEINSLVRGAKFRYYEQIKEKFDFGWRHRYGGAWIVSHHILA